MNAASRAIAAVAHAVRRPLLRRRVGRLVVERVEGLPFVVLPQVFNPALFRSSGLLVRALAALPAPAAGARALDLGTGSGVAAVFAAQIGYGVVAVDVNPEAVRCARINALLNRCEERVEVRQGDLFAPLAGERFELVLFNPPFFRGAPRDDLDRAWRSPDLPERFAAGLPPALAPGGRALVVASTDGLGRGLPALFAGAGLAAEVALARDFGNEVLTVWSVR
jgi:methylase of polypeptide subunit release factors